MAVTLSDLATASSYPQTIAHGASNFTSGISSGIFFDVGYRIASTGASFWTGAQTTPAAYSAGGTLYYNGDTGFTPFTKASSTKVLRLLKVSNNTSTSHVQFLVDKVWACSGLSSNTTSTQTISSFPTLPRYTSSTSLQPFLMVYSANGTTASNFTITYTNNNNVSGRVSQTMTLPASSSYGTLIPIYLQSGDESIGIKSITSITFATASGTAGDIGLTLASKITSLFTISGNESHTDFATMGLPAIENDAALTLFMFTNSTQSGAFNTWFTIVELDD